MAEPVPLFLVIFCPFEASSCRSLQTLTRSLLTTGICSAALPCDNEVPCACAILGCKLCACDWKGWNSNYSSCYWSTRSKDYGMVDGGAPSVEVLYSRLSSLTRPSPAILIK